MKFSVSRNGSLFKAYAKMCDCDVTSIENVSFIDLIFSFIYIKIALMYNYFAYYFINCGLYIVKVFSLLYHFFVLLEYPRSYSDYFKNELYMSSEERVLLKNYFIAFPFANKYLRYKSFVFAPGDFFIPFVFFMMYYIDILNMFNFWLFTFIYFICYIYYMFSEFYAYDNNCRSMTETLLCYLDKLCIVHIK